MSFHKGSKDGLNVGVNIVLVDKDNRILLGRRKNVFGAGDWGLPGGHAEFGERLCNTAVREVFEETGLSISASKLDFLGMVNQLQSHKDGRRHYLQVGFVVRGVEGEVKLVEPDKCSSWKWFSKVSLPGNIFTAHKKLLDIYLGRLDLKFYEESF